MANSQQTRLLIEAGPLVVFFVTNWQAGIMVGTAAFMMATAISFILSYRLERRLPLMPLVGCFFVTVFGGLTLWFDDEIFIKLKPTIVNLLFASVLFAGLVMRRNPMKIILGAMIQLDDDGWRKLAVRWAGFFVVLALLNEIVWRSLSTDAWVNFKVFGIMPLTLVFSAFQMPLILRHQVPDEPEAAVGKDAPAK